MKKTIKLKAMRSIAGNLTRAANAAKVPLVIIAIVAVIGFATIACSKKAEAQSSNGSSGSSSGGGASSSSSSAKEIPISDLKYVLTKDGKGVRITNYNGGSGYGDLIIPSTIEGYPVVEIGNNDPEDDFYDIWDIPVGFYRFNSLVIPESVKVIGAFAFSGCSVASIVIPNSVTSIGVGAFYKMENLASATLPDGLKVISAGLFRECPKLSRVNLPASLEEIQESAFFLCSELTELIIPDNIQNVRFSNAEFSLRNDPDNLTFLGCQRLPLATRARIQGWGYKSDF